MNVLQKIFDSLRGTLGGRNFTFAKMLRRKIFVGRIFAVKLCEGAILQLNLGKTLETLKESQLARK